MSVRLAAAPPSNPTTMAVRLALLLLAALLALGTGADRETFACILVVIMLALVGRLRPEGPRFTWGLLITELLVAVGGVALLGGAVDPLLICLTSTVLAIGLAGGYVPAVLATVGAGLTLLILQVLDAGSLDAMRDRPSHVGQWIGMALVMGLLAARIRSLAGGDDLSDNRYAEAYRLLAQLRAVSRNLPGSLDPGSVAHSLMAECINVAECEYGAVFLQVGGDQLVPLALHGYQRVPWRASLTDGGPIQRAWLSGSIVVDRRQPDPNGLRRGSTLMVLPMTVDGRRVALVALEWRRTDDLPASRKKPLMSLVARSALPIETAALFDELRMSAAAEERSRLAREMHDGIAQDLAYLGYEVDALIKSLDSDSESMPHQQAMTLRRRLTEFIGELRLSITDLRSSVGPGRGLGAALSEYARSVGTSTGMTVHLSLTEGSTRLSADAEVQLLRIAHEAITRARRRPDARNLWVSLTADPPAASLVIEDDGRNEGVAYDDERSQVQLMDEGAARLGARVTTTPRNAKGTRVEVTMTGVAREYDRSSR